MKFYSIRGVFLERQTRCCLSTIPGLAHRRQSVACQKKPNWFTGLSFMALLHLHMKTEALICGEVKLDIKFIVQELKEENQHISQI